MIKPRFKTAIQDETDNFARVIFEPLEIGFGHTLATSLRRVLYTSLEGAAVTFLKIEGVRHQFSTLPGLKEDIVELILNVKQIRIRYTGDKPATMSLSVKGPKEIKAGDIETPAGVEIINPELIIAHLDREGKLNVEFTVESGLGYSPAEERKTGSLGLIPVDAKFSPVVLVNYTVGTTRVGRMTNLDKLVLEVTTDGTIGPVEAVRKSAQVLVDFFNQVINPVEIPAEENNVSASPVNDTFRLTVEELDLPTRIANALRKGGFENVSDIIRTPKKDIAKVKNLGTKSVKIIEAALREKSIELTD